MQFDDTGTQDGGTAVRAQWAHAGLQGVAWLLCLLLLALPLTASAADGESASVEMRVFDIPAQSLPQALQLYGETTGVAVLIDAHMLGGLRSAPLTGRHAPLPALQILLQGTGLSPRFVPGGGFTVVATDAQPAEPALRSADSTASPALSPTAQQRVARIIQHSLEAALCSRRSTRPGSYRLALQLWLDASHRVQQATVLEGSGDARRDAAIVKQLAGLAMPGLPSDVPQPLTVLLLPHGASSTPPCQVSP